MTTVELKADELKVGHVVVAKRGGFRYAVVEVSTGMTGGPYLKLKPLSTNDGELGHDTSFDAWNATYTVERPDPSDKG
jgi:hypothetical protein